MATEKSPGELPNYSFGDDAVAARLAAAPSLADLDAGLSQNCYVPALRSKPAAIAPIKNLSGSQSFGVTVTIDGRQRKKHFHDYEDAELQRVTWESARIQSGSALRMRFTLLNDEQLEEATAAFRYLAGTGGSLMDAAIHYLKNPPKSRVGKPLAEAHREFLAERAPFISAKQIKNYRQIGVRLITHLKPGITLEDVTTEVVHKWLRGLQVAKKTWNTYRDDLSGMFEWFRSKPRVWIDENPIEVIPRRRKKDVLKGEPQRLAVKTCAELMVYLESERPEWCTFFVCALFWRCVPKEKWENWPALSPLMECKNIFLTVFSDFLLR